MPPDRELPVAFIEFAAHLQDWLEAADEGHSALTGIHTCLEELNAAPEDRGAPPAALTKLLQLAPSPALERYTAAAARGMDKTSGRQLPADDLHARARQLAAAAARLRSCADGMAAAWGRHADTVLAAPQARAAGESAGEAQEGFAGGCGGQAADGGAPGSGHSGDGSGGGGGDDVDQTEAAEPRDITAMSDEELGLLMSAHSAAAAKCTEWMAKSAAAVTLEGAPEEVEAYAQLWDLRPPLDGAAAAALVGAVLEAQRRRGAARPAGA